MAKAWMPVPKSLEYDLVTSAIKDGYIPDGYSVCWAKEVDGAPTVALTPERVEALRKMVNWLESVSTWNSTLAVIIDMLTEAQVEKNHGE